eukprot:2873523-Amphidinium_carterae.1
MSYVFGRNNLTDRELVLKLKHWLYGGLNIESSDRVARMKPTISGGSRARPVGSIRCHLRV